MAKGSAPLLYKSELACACRVAACGVYLDSVAIQGALESMCGMREDLRQFTHQLQVRVTIEVGHLQEELLQQTDKQHIAAAATEPLLQGRGTQLCMYGDGAEASVPEVAGLQSTCRMLWRGYAVIYLLQ